MGNFLKSKIKNEEKNDAIVVGIPRAGIITSDIVAKILSADFEILIPRKLTDPYNKEQAIGAIMEDGSTYIINESIEDSLITKEYLEHEIDLQLKEIERRKTIYRPLHQNLDALCSKILKHKTIILTDDGISTGSTILTAAKWIRKMEIQNNKQKSCLKRLIIATTVAPRNAIDLLKRECNAEVEAVFSPSFSSFHSVEQYHQNWDIVTDKDVINIMQKRNQLPSPNL